MIYLTPKQNQSFFVYRIQSKEKKFTEKELFQEKGEVEDWTKNKKGGVLTAFVTVNKKDLTASIRKHANELKLYGKTVRTAIKQNLSPGLNLLNYVMWGILENQTNAASHLNIGLLQTSI